MISRSWARSGRSWNRALADMRLDRAVLPEIREARLRSTAHLCGTTTLALSAWRGRSGRRYVVGVHILDPAGQLPAALAEAGKAVALAVHRDPATGIADLRAATVSDRRWDVDIASWLTAAASAGANELHIHRLAQSEAARAAIVVDLTDPMVSRPS